MWRRSFFLAAEWWHFSKFFGNENLYYINIKLGTQSLHFFKGFHSADKLVNHRFLLAQKMSATQFLCIRSASLILFCVRLRHVETLLILELFGLQNPGSLNTDFFGDQTIQIYGNFEGFPLQ